MFSTLLSVLAGIAAFFALIGLLWAFVSFMRFLVDLIRLPFSITGLIVAVIQQKRGMGEDGKTIARRALLVGAVGAILLALIAFVMGASLTNIGIAALIGLFLGAIFGL